MQQHLLPLSTQDAYSTEEIIRELGGIMPGVEVTAATDALQELGSLQ